MKWIMISLGILIFAYRSSCDATTPPTLQPYHASYEISWYGIPAGISYHSLQHRHDNEYHFEVKTNPKFTMLPYRYTEKSDFIFNDGRFIPQNYYYNVQEGKRKKLGHVVFDWNTKTLSNQRLEEPWQAELPEHAQDKITQTLSIRQALLKGENHFHYTVVEEDKLKEYRFTQLGEEPIKTKLGMISATKVEHVSLKGVRTTLWLSKQFDYLPIKMTQERHGKLVASGDILSYSPDKN